MKIVTYFILLSCLIVSSFAADNSPNPKQKLHLRAENHEQQLDQQLEKYKLIKDNMEVKWDSLRRVYDTNNNLATRNDQRVAFLWSLQHLSPKLPEPRHILDFLGLSFLNPWSKTCLRNVVDTASKMIHPLHVLEKFSKFQIPAGDLQRRIETGAPVQYVVNRMFREYDWAQLSLEEKNERFAREVEKRGLKMEAPFKEGCFPLLKAANNNDVMKVEILIVIGADVNQANDDGDTPLLIASERGHKEVVAKLIKAGADVSKANVNGWTPLHVASARGHVEVVQLLLGATGIDVNAKNNDGETPLHVASLWGHVGVVAQLTAAGADVNKPDIYGINPLHVASRKGYEKVVRLLINAGANIDQTLPDGRTPLYVASQEGHAEVVKVLLDNGADVNQADKDGWTPLYAASYKGHVGVVQQLITAGATVDEANEHGETPLYIASYKGHEGVIQLLINAGADVKQPNKNGITPLHTPVFQE